MKAKVIGLIIMMIAAVIVLIVIKPALTNDWDNKPFCFHRGDCLYDEKCSFGDKHHLCKHKACISFYISNAEELKLSKEQLVKLNQLKNEIKAAKIHKFTEIQILKMEVEYILDKKNPDLREIDSRVDKMSQLKKEMKKLCLRAIVKSQKILSQEQIKQAEQMWKSCDISPHWRLRDNSEEFYHSRSGVRG